jgi:cyclic beta-1,2-glucan synthetase
MTLINRVLRRGTATSPWLSHEPVREELFSLERLQQHARSLADAQPVAPRSHKGHALAGRLEDNAVTLLAAYRAIAASIEARQSITPAAEWLVDNYYLVERQIREIRAALPRGYYRQLPKLIDGPFAGYPRVFGLAWAFVAHTDSHFDAEMLCGFLHAYQEVQPLTIGELWAVAITLRIVLIENLRRLAEQIMRNSAARQLADDLADRLLGTGGRTAESVADVLDPHRGTRLRAAFAVQLALRLRDQDPRITPALTWLEEHLLAQGSSVDAVVRDEHQRQGASSVTVRNIIISMRLIADVDWTELFERVSLVNDALMSAGTQAANQAGIPGTGIPGAGIPGAGIPGAGPPEAGTPGAGFAGGTESVAFRDMDFPTRNLYRNAIEELARGANRPELEIARLAIQAAQQAAAAPAPKSLAKTDPKRGDPKTGGPRDVVTTDGATTEGATIDGAATDVSAIQAPAIAATEIAEVNRRRDPGYYLFGEGRRAFEVAIGFRPALRDWPERLGRRFGIAGYVACGMLVAALLLVFPLFVLHTSGFGLGWLCLLAVLGFIPALDGAVALVNREVTHGLGATILPALELRAGVPASLRTVIVVPTMLTSIRSVEQHVEHLEVHYLASPPGELHFALLTDWMDADTEHVEGDEALLAAATEGVARLNARYGRAPGGDRFLLLHRKRVWNASEGRWIGWERKRGKLHELNRLLRGATDTTFIGLDTASGVVSSAHAPVVPDNVRYVITLDADTRLPRDTVRRLIGKMAHPLNRPRFDPDLGRVVAGHAVLQPRVTPALPVGNDGSLFQRVFSSMNGIDPYGAAVSDVYQDLFDEGSYAGKGIYDIDAFEAALSGRVPDSTLLSHDLFEGTFARAGLASDIEVVEDFPARYDIDALRHHRWARGDWQLLPWMLGLGPRQGALTGGPAVASAPSGGRAGGPAVLGSTFLAAGRLLPGDASLARDTPGAANRSASSSTVPAMGRWKMVDNLRRTLSAPFCVLSLLAGWTMPLQAAAVWTAFIVLTIVLPAFIPVVSAVLPRRAGVTPRSHWNALTGDLRLAVMQAMLVISFLGHQAWLMGDAIIRTVVRLFITHRHLLEWVPTAQTTIGRGLALGDFYRVMAGGVALGCLVVPLALLSGLAAGNLAHGAWPLALPFAALWVASPAIARWTSLPSRGDARTAVSPDDAIGLRLIARRTWRFFETFVTPADNMLPPDNFQEDPAPVVAHRTSPTNLGLYLLSVATARDFAWVGTTDAVERLEATFATMTRMERFRGHFFNWYDTKDLRPLDPRYISTVDSGNLAGHLITLANACREWTQRAPTPAQCLAGIADALALAREAIEPLREGPRTQTVTWHQLAGTLTQLEADLRAPTDDARLPALLADLAQQCETMADIASAFAAERGDEAGSWDTSEDPSRDVSLGGEAGRTSGANSSIIAGSVKSGGVTSAAPSGAPSTAPSGSPSGTPSTAPSGADAAADMLFWIAALRRTIGSHRRDLDQTQDAAAVLTARLMVLETTARTTALAMGYSFLFDKERKLLSIGYRVQDGSLDPSCYDLLASEARLASFIAIAKGDVPARHWFHLGRAVTPIADGAALLSWSGSMFEYLMPELIMRAPVGSLLEQTGRLVVWRQIAYGVLRGLPWGISESAYNARDLEFTYQYSNFGVRGLGLKRGLGENAVVAPYATALASMVDPKAAARNFERLAGIGARGRYGFYEALDYTPGRLPEGAKVAIVRAFMAHHQGMSIVAIADALLNGLMRTRFHAEPIVQATELLLQEGTPRDVAAVRPWVAEGKSDTAMRVRALQGGRRLGSAHTASPTTHLLSNGNYTVMLTAAGSGYSHWRGLAVTRWREDATCDDWGSYIFLRDVGSGAVWSAGLQPTGAEPDAYGVIFNEDRAEFARRDGTLTTTMEVIVSTEDDAEVRRVSIANAGNQTREIDVTSYAELVLGPQQDDVAHQAFMKLFVATEYLVDHGTILATRRRRTPTEAEIWAAHLATVDGGTPGGSAVGRPQVATDRARFLGRGNDIHHPIAVVDGRPLSNSVGTVLDPIFALRRRVSVAPGATVRIAFWTVLAGSRQAVLDQVDKHRDSAAFERAATLAWTQAQVQLHHLGIDPGEAGQCQRLAGHLLYAGPTLRPSSETILRGAGGQPGLWPMGISGDHPIVLLRIAEVEHLGLARQLLKAHEYWRMKRLPVDVVILNERASSYVQDLQIALETLARAGQSPPPPGQERRRGRIFVLRADLSTAEARALLLSVARVVLIGGRGSLSDQLDRVPEPRAMPRVVRRPTAAGTEPPAAAPRPQLEFFNGLGGFAPGGREYVTVLGPGLSTPAPWINVIANPEFGFQVATEGGGCTWSMNSRENQLTPWSNDPVSDRPGEVFYLRDDDTGALWCPTALPIRDDAATYVARHGWGYSRFEHTAHGITAELLQYVPLSDPLKISRLTLHNTTGRTRRISLTAYVEFVLGPSRTASLAFVSTEIDPVTGALFARNPWQAAFGERVAFLDLAGRQTDWTGDRRAFIGRNGTLQHPAALASWLPLPNTVGAGLDPCGALRTSVVLPPHARVELVCFLGQAADTEDAQALVARYRAANLTDVLAEVTEFWDTTLGAVQVKTPDRSMDIMLNGWLLYQTLACRVWARSAFYQASGAYGFRDQLQDGMALAAAQPAMTRAHLLRAASRQFIEGDVQHWWLPHSGQGVRTRISDDRGWLAYTVAHYVAATGDSGVLDEQVPFIEGQLLQPGEHDAFFTPTVSDEVGTLFEHCARGLDASMEVGYRGLPLMGTGDWNDGMNRVGELGQGESVWLGWLLYAALNDFAKLAEARGEAVRAWMWRSHAIALQESAETEAWDGDWYRRAWFDDGTPVGSATEIECRIDSISQSWAVLSGAGDPARTTRAMAAVERELTQPQDQLALLFTPPFDKTTLDPGYIKGYPPGIRENGGQYTHAALWSVIALAMLGEGDKAEGLFALLNPINHTRTRSDVHRYKVEPYVVAADVYATPPHVGRGGWTWYTGSGGWMQRAGIESILGVRVHGDVLVLQPCIPRDWPGFEIALRHRSSRYMIVVENPDQVCRGIASAQVDGAEVYVDPFELTLLDDGDTHYVRVKLG